MTQTVRERVLRFYDNNPGREMRVIQFARWYGVNRVTASLAIRKLVAEKVLATRRSGKEILYFKPAPEQP